MARRHFNRLLAAMALGATTAFAPKALAPAARVWAGEAVPQSSTPAGQDFDLNVLDRQIGAELRTNPALAGAWLFVDFSDQGDPGVAPGYFTFRRVLDRSRAAEQRRELERLIRDWVPKGNYRIETKLDRLYPFSELLASLIEAVENDAALGGCSISGGHYASDPNVPERLVLVLNGRIAREAREGEDESAEGQDVLIERLCGQWMRRDPAWVKTGAGSTESEAVPLAIVPSSRELKVVEPSEAKGRFFYGAGVRHFWHGQYDLAAEDFRQAELESPRTLAYHYWWILTELAMNRTGRAQARMQMVVERFRGSDFDRQSPEYRTVIRSLERVQGPLRRSLQRLETEALFRDSRVQAN